MTPQPNALHAFGGIWRMTYPAFVTPFRLVITLVALAGYGLAMHAILGRNPGEWRELVVLFAVTLVPTLAFMSGAWAVRQEMGSPTVDYVLTRPLSRVKFLLFRFVAQFFWIEVGALCALAVLASVASSRGVTGLREVIPWLVLAQFLAVGAATAFGFLCAAITNRYMIVGLMYAGTIEAALGNTPIQLNQVSMLRHVRTLVATGLDAQRGLATADPSVPSVWLPIGLLVVFTVLVATGAGYVFSIRQFTGGGRD